jgi:serine/threonine protein kinase
MGSVYRAVNTSIGRPVAIKLLHASVLGSQDIVDRFVREGRAATMAVHPNIVQVLDFDRDEQGVPFIVQELLEGRDLAEHLAAAGGVLSPKDALEISAQAADGLAAAHDKGLVHRDIKPGNIFLATVGGATTVKLVDFGISKLQLPEDIKRTAAGTLMGTPLYMSPEQILRPLEVDARTDVWAMGVVLYEMVTGRSPFDGASTSEIFHRITELDHPPVERWRPDCPPSVVDVVRVCLAKAPDARFNDGRELGEAVRRATARAEGVETEILGSTPPPPANAPLPWGELEVSPKTPATPRSAPSPPRRPAPAKKPVADPLEPGSVGDDPLRPSAGAALSLDEGAIRQVSRAPARKPEYRPPPPEHPITLTDAILGTCFVGGLAWAAPRSSLAALEELLGHPPGLAPLEAVGGLFVLIVFAFVCWMLLAAARERGSWALLAAGLGSLALLGTSAATLVWFGFPRLPFPDGSADHLLLTARGGAIAVAAGLSAFGLWRLAETLREGRYPTAAVVFAGGLLGFTYVVLSVLKLAGVTLLANL